MKGFLSIEPDGQTVSQLKAVQNGLREALARQGVSFPERLSIALLTWPFASDDQLFEAAERLQSVQMPSLRLESLEGRPNSDRPAEIGYAVAGAEELQATLFRSLREPLDPDLPKPAFVRLVRVSPASRKVGVALRGSALLGTREPEFVPSGLILWKQSPQGFEVCRTMPLNHGRP